jgi:hypothetical protein
MQQKLLITAFAIFAMLACVARGEQVVNPIFKSWEKVKVGSSTTLSMSTLVEGRSTKMEVKGTLIEITADGAVVENAVTVYLGGAPMQAPTQRTTIKKMVERDSKDPGQLDAAKLEKATDEKVTVPAGTFDAKVIVINGEKDGVTMDGKVWFSEQVPGGTIKMDIRTQGKHADVTAELTAMEKK